MHVRVLFFGAAADAASRRSQTVSLPEGATLAALLAHCAKEFSGIEKLRGALALSLNQEHAAPSAILKEGDEVALLPPVSGGLPAAVAPPPKVQLVHDRIVTEQMLEAIKQPEDGAVAVFEGIVRNHSGGRRTLYLEYDAYEEMALRQMRQLIAHAQGSFDIRQAVLIHRLGRLEIGETSVLVAVASAHRAAAFEACRWLIDELKKTVPIWKKEFFEDGAVWAPGTPLASS